MHAIKDLENLLSFEYPELIEQIKQIIEESERKFSGRDKQKKEALDGFLWEHTVHVAALARRVAKDEGVDVKDAVIAALFHDSGKFVEGRYHDDEKPEEEGAAELAQKILSESGMDPMKIEAITEALAALYSDTASSSRIADVVHDADFLAKFGYLGVANFFTKSALRGQTLNKTLISSLSKELTYAAALETNMQTSAGKKMAAQKRAATQSYYHGLLGELREARIAFFIIKEESFPCPKNPDKLFSLKMAVPEVCPVCGGQLTMDFTSQTKTKCEQLIAEIHCDKCPNQYEISFCLPEIVC
jgi:putative nucleotidyltransferase with HDIG domain